jgi:hypothetical protein
VAMLASLPLAASGAEVGGVNVEERANVAGSELRLNGAGLRKMYLVKVYVAGLYLTEKKTSPADILALAGPKRVSVILMRDLSARQFVDALDKGIRENSSATEQLQLESDIECLMATLLSFRRGKKGDVITIDWLPDTGTVVLVNGEAKGKAIPRDALYQAFLRVWVGDKPTNARLKRALLGRVS